MDELPEGMRETVCKALLRERYEEVNGICAEVQEQLDAQNGIRLQPQRAPYPAERVQQVAHALEDPTVALSVIQRRAKAPVANVSKSFHDDYMQKNADVRSRLGFKCYLNRVAATGCCKWCTDIAGRYVYGDHPDEVFHRHDNLPPARQLRLHRDLRERTGAAGCVVKADVAGGSGGGGGERVQAGGQFAGTCSGDRETWTCGVDKTGAG